MVSFPGGLTVSSRISAWRSSTTSSRSEAIAISAASRARAGTSRGAAIRRRPSALGADSVAPQLSRRSGSSARGAPSAGGADGEVERPQLLDRPASLRATRRVSISSSKSPPSSSRTCSSRPTPAVRCRRPAARPRRAPGACRRSPRPAASGQARGDRPAARPGQLARRPVSVGREDRRRSRRDDVEARVLERQPLRRRRARTRPRGPPSRLARACSSSGSEKSSPVTSAPARAARSATSPVPVAEVEPVLAGLRLERCDEAVVHRREPLRDPLVRPRRPTSRRRRRSFSSSAVTRSLFACAVSSFRTSHSSG